MKTLKSLMVLVVAAFAGACAPVDDSSGAGGAGGTGEGTATATATATTATATHAVRTAAHKGCLNNNDCDYGQTCQATFCVPCAGVGSGLGECPCITRLDCPMPAGYDPACVIPVCLESGDCSSKFYGSDVFCGLRGRCDGQGGCNDITPKTCTSSCDDGDPCTVDYCDPEVGKCANVFSPSLCP